jgi:hypothetical protein
MAWNQVQRPLAAGGLGIPNLELMGKALRLRWLWKQKDRKGTEDSLYFASEVASTSAFFLASVRCAIGNGAAMLFWSDPWLDGRCVTEWAPDLVVVVSARIRKSRSVQSALQGNTWIRDITGALTIPAIIQYIHLRERVQQVVLQPDVQDSSWRWSTSGDFSSKCLCRPTHGLDRAARCEASLEN